MTVDQEPLKLIIAGFHDDVRSAMDKHYEPYFAIHFAISGTFNLSIGNRSWELDGPWLWTGYPGPRFRFSRAGKSRPWVKYYYGFTGEIARRWLKTGLLPRHPRPVHRLEDARAAADELVELRNADGMRGQLAANLLERLLLLVGDEPTDKPAWFVDLEQQARAEPAWQPDWDAVARKCRLPPSSFRKRFMRIAGRPPQRWLIERRIAAARALLDQGTGVAEVAERLGYTDIFFFSRQFRSWVGIPPSVYARGETR